MQTSSMNAVSPEWTFAALPMRHAVEADLPRIIEIHNESLPTGSVPVNYPTGHPQNWDTWWSLHSPTRHPVCVHENAGKVMAWISLSPLYRRKVFRGAAECSLYVTPDAQRQGIGTRLVPQVLTLCPALGIQTVLAFVDWQNLASLKIFHRAGFASWGSFLGTAQRLSDSGHVVMLGKKMG